MPHLPEFATVDPFDGMTADQPGVVRNLVAGKWVETSVHRSDIVDPMNGAAFLSVPDTTDHEPFIAGLKSCPKSGLHNPHKLPDRYVMLGRVCAKAAALMATDHVADYFSQLIQRVMPKS